LTSRLNEIVAPAVSVCIPAYNHGRFLADTLKSALDQSFADMEIIVSDNRSSDHTQEVVMAIVERDARVRYVLAPEHLGMQGNFNRCLELARGRYIKFLCADDMLEPRCVERMLAAFRDERTALVGCARRILPEDGGSGRVLGYAAGDVTSSGTEAIHRCFFRGNLIGEPTAVMFRRADAKDGFRAQYQQLVDLDMWFRLLEKGRFTFLAEALCSIREHGAQATRSSIASGRVSADKELLYAEFSRKPHVAGTVFERLLWDFRMAWSVQRERAAGHVRTPSTAVYFRGLRAPMTVGARIAWAFHQAG